MAFYTRRRSSTNQPFLNGGYPLYLCPLHEYCSYVSKWVQAFLCKTRASIAETHTHTHTHTRTDTLTHNTWMTGEQRFYSIQP